MALRVTIFQSLSHDSLLSGCYASMCAENIDLSFLTASPELNAVCFEQNWPVRKIPRFLADEKPTHFFLFFKAPLLIAACFFYLARLKIAKKTDAVLCLAWPEKLAVTPAAALLGIKCVWLDTPPAEYPALPRLFKLIYRRQARRACVITLQNRAKDDLLKAGVAPKNILTVMPGIKPADYSRQDNLFTNLAHTGHNSRNRKYFTLGAAVALEEGRQNLETLFRAVKNCLAVIPSIQLIVMGSGREKKNLEWLAKKMDITPVVWFVGEPAHPGKWLENIDIYVVAAPILHLPDLRLALYALALGRPLIGPAGSGLEDLIWPDQNGFLLEPGQSEPLERAIIDLERNRRLLKRFAEKSRMIAANNFTLEQMAGQLSKIIKTRNE